MANPEHVEIVKRGKDAIDEWRLSHPNEHLNLTKADLRLAELVGVHLRGGRLREATLRDIDLRGADLRNTDFILADLRGANLFQADLRWADLHACDLCDASLDNANLEYANLSETNFKSASLVEAALSGTRLNGANFSAARFRATRLDHADLSGALNLDLVVHDGPSQIGIDTLFMSQGKIPDLFLRGCGVPDALITFLPSLIGVGIEFYSSFISYSQKDEEFARRLHSRMQQEHLRVWFAPEDIAGGKKLHEQIFDAIRVHDKLLLVLSDHSMSSEWVSTEIRRARKREREEGRQVLFPIRLVEWPKIATWEGFDADSGKDLAVELREYYIPDFSDWKDHDKFEAEFKKLLRDLKQPGERKGHGDHRA